MVPQERRCMLPLARCQSEALPLHSREPFDSLNLTPLSELLSGTMAYWLPVLKGTQRVTSASACRILNVLCYVGSHTLGQNASDAVYSTWPLGLTSLGPANKLLRPSTYAGNLHAVIASLPDSTVRASADGYPPHSPELLPESDMR
ncbi:hypothetical protein BJV77DRAFT_806911 [Russula vinacea]|nr:hypothetical protein BJV77DRAFT_806911 [Russula vinacea]